MKKIFSIALCIILNAQIINAAKKRDINTLENEQENTEREKKIQKTQNINEEIKIKNIKHFFEEIKKMSLNFEKTLFIFDLDGVITNRSHPNARSKNKQQIKPRGSIIDLIAILHETGSHVIVSSAWKDFNETLQRVNGLNLGEILNLNQTFIVSDANLETKYYQNGNLISVRYKSNVNQEYFPQKALSAHYAYPNITFENVIFIDDTKDNITIFQEDIKKMAYAKNAHIHLFCLSKINGANKPEDIISSEDLESFKASFLSKTTEYSIHDDATNENQENEQTNGN
ncbi:MAG: hypothetical protein Q8S31_00155 [Alphaproteobacteria bacterium]|nr:hypothetical protein [Alphaproteobacteria bacterium]